MNLGAFFLIVKLKTSRRFVSSSTVDTWFSFYWSSPNGALPSTPHSAHLKLSILDQLSQLRGATVQVWYCDHLWWWCLTDEEEDRCYCCWGFSFNLLDHVQRLSSAETHWAHHAHKRSQHHHRRLAAIRSNDNWLELLHELKNGNWTVFKYDQMRWQCSGPGLGSSCILHRQEERSEETATDWLTRAVARYL